MKKATPRVAFLMPESCLKRQAACWAAMASTLGFITAKYKGGTRLNNIILDTLWAAVAPLDGIQRLVGFGRLVVVV